MLEEESIKRREEEMKPIDAPHLHLPSDRCVYCFYTSKVPLTFRCKHPDGISGDGYAESCTEEDWGKCPLNFNKEENK